MALAEHIFAVIGIIAVVVGGVAAVGFGVMVILAKGMAD